MTSVTNLLVEECDFVVKDDLGCGSESGKQFQFEHA